MNNKHQTDPLGPFIDRKIKIDDLLEKLKQHNDKHFGVDPEVIGWGDVGSLGYVIEQLEKIVNFLEGRA